MRGGVERRGKKDEGERKTRRGGGSGVGGKDCQYSFFFFLKYLVSQKKE